MTRATREALEKVDQILHEAGWDTPSSPQEPGIAPEKLACIQHDFETVLGLSAEDASRLVKEVVERTTAY